VPSLRADASSLLEVQKWPGNVRELETVLLRAMVSPAYPESVGARDLEPFLALREPAPA
jgi:transcriptional regulator with PAS, ATPase and Fis domain